MNNRCFIAIPTKKCIFFADEKEKRRNFAL